jgi:hypothetical protein
MKPKPKARRAATPLDRAVQTFESRFTDVHEFDPERKVVIANTAPNGVPWRTVASGRTDGNLEYWSSEAFAIEMWLREARALAGEHKTLYWRSRPTMQLKGDLDTGQVCVYSRMAFGD